VGHCVAGMGIFDDWGAALSLVSELLKSKGEQNYNTLKLVTKAGVGGGKKPVTIRGTLLGGN